MFDWRYELQQCIDAACNPAIDKDQREACALSAGRIILFAEEDLIAMEYEYILHALHIDKPFANVYKYKYLASIGRLVEMNEQIKNERANQQQTYHPNCRCVMPLDELEDNND